MTKFIKAKLIIQQIDYCHSTIIEWLIIQPIIIESDLPKNWEQITIIRQKYKIISVSLYTSHNYTEFLNNQTILSCLKNQIDFDALTSSKYREAAFQKYIDLINALINYQ